jgi:spindle assembly abnormal protein 6
VSELSHKLGSAQGAQQSLEQEVAELRERVKALAADKHSSEVAASETKAKLMAAEDKVGLGPLAGAVLVQMMSEIT